MRCLCFQKHLNWKNRLYEELFFDFATESGNICLARCMVHIIDQKLIKTATTDCMELETKHTYPLVVFRDIHTKNIRRKTARNLIFHWTRLKLLMVIGQRNVRDHGSGNPTSWNVNSQPRPNMVIQMLICVPCHQCLFAVAEFYSLSLNFFRCR